MYEARPSPIGGLGLFATRTIRRGTVWWQPDPSQVILLTRRQYQVVTRSTPSPLSSALIEPFLHFGYYDRDLDAIIVALDDTRYVNHSPTPNSGPTEPPHPFRALALRDIAPGEEIVEDYTAYDHCPWAQMDLSYTHDLQHATFDVQTDANSDTGAMTDGPHAHATPRHSR
ncbi:SET domain-containing protein [Actinosynnema sp. NPDC023658]|uniref:SET domain-containing protein n=1 Tax=Actinosynnema sp. NPDC023658 TaxID=3155465 RepID=UPI0033FAB882